MMFKLLRICYRVFFAMFFFRKDCSPKRCLNCWSSNLDEKEKDSINDITCEIEIRCSRCGQNAGYWAYGSYDPGYMRHYILEDAS